jgi:hypothetical protein
VVLHISFEQPLAASGHKRFSVQEKSCKKQAKQICKVRKMVVFNISILIGRNLGVGLVLVIWCSESHPFFTPFISSPNILVIIQVNKMNWVEKIESQSLVYLTLFAKQE